MRQAGVLAAAGWIALEEMPGRLAEDHANAKFLANALAKFSGIAIDPSKVVTNIAVFDFSGTGMKFAELADALKSRGVLISTAGGTRARVVTHLNVSRQDCETAVRVMEEVLSQVCAPKVT